MKRVVITGMGCISPLGQSVSEVWDNCLAGYSRFSEIPEQWHDYADHKSRLWAPLPEIDFARWPISRVDQMQCDPFALLAIAATFDALKDAGLDYEVKDKRHNTFSLTGIDSERAGVHLGTGIGGAHTFLSNYTYHLLANTKADLLRLAESLEPSDAFISALSRLHHPRRYNPFVVSMLMPNAAGAALGIKFALNGANVTHTVACAASTVAIGEALRSIRDGALDLVLTGGSEYLNDPCGGFFHGFDIAGTLANGYTDPDKANRPFDTGHCGFLFSEGGAAILVLESLDHAMRRNASIVAEVCGFAQTFDAHNMMSIGPDSQQIERMLRLALKDAQARPEEVDYVNAHGTGTEKNDTMECVAIEHVFGNEVLINATKSMSGHLIGASGALETIVTALSLRDQTTHACRNLEQPIAGLNFVREVRRQDIDIAVNQSFAFGGHNAALILKRFKP